MINNQRSQEPLRGKKITIGMFLLAGIFLILLTSFVVAQYSKSSPQFGAPGGISTSYLRSQGVDTFPIFNPDMCGKGQDFVLQIAPFGCSPAVVRSDLLEEQNVPVFCQIAATKINPLIDVKTIESMSFKGKYPKEVSGVGFHPAQAAVKSQKTLLNSPILENIGYAVIVLRQQKNESSMPDFVEGNLTVKIKYDIENAFGIGKANYYLPELNDDQWGEKYKQYGFWNGKGFLRAESIDADSAVVSIYSDENNKISTFNLRKGQTSPQVYLPGFYCLANLKIRLDGLEAPDTRAKLEINGEIVEVAEKEQFLQNSCGVIGEPKKEGINQKVGIRCRTDEGVDRFELRIAPKIRLEFEGAKEEGYSIGEKLPFSDEGNKNVYLGYARTEGDSGKEEDLYVRFVQTPYRGNILSDEMLSEVARYDRDSFDVQKGGFVNKVLSAFVKVSKNWVERFARYLIQGSEISNVLNYNYQKDVYGTQVKLIGFVGAKDNSKIFEENNDLKQNYENAMSDYRKIINGFPNEKENQNSQETFAERALINLIDLADSAEQKKKMVELCQEFEERYPDSNKPSKCKDELEISNSEISTRSVFVNGGVKEISFKGIYEPSLDEYGVEIFIRNAGENYSGSVSLRRNARAYFSKSEFIELKELNSDYALFDVSSVDEGKLKEVAWKTSYLKIELNNHKVVGKDNYEIQVIKINLKSVARVSVIPGIDNAGTEANISFKIGIEKRGIQLSPDKIKARIANLDKSIEKWEGTSETLGNVVRGFNTACLMTGTYLTVSNFFSNLDGESIARKEVMRSDGGWTDICKDALSTGKLNGDAVNYNSLDHCFSENNDAIENDVKAYFKAMEGISIKEEDLCGELIKIKEGLGEKITNGQTGNKEKEIVISDDIQAAFNPDLKEEGGDNKKDVCSKVSLTQAKNLLTYQKFLESNPNSNLKGSFERERYLILSDIKENAENYAAYNKYLEDIKKLDWISGATNVDFQSSDPNAVVGNYGGAKANEDYGGAEANEDYGYYIKKGDLVQPISFDNTRYYVTLKDNGRNLYSIENVYDESGNFLDDGAKINSIKSKYGKGFKKYDSSSWNNPFKRGEAEVRYFETEPYKGLPAIVPFDTKNGWYVRMKQTLPGFGKIRAYDDSGRVASFWLCNIGENGKIDGLDRDDCQQFNPATGQIVSTFQGLDSSKTTKLVKCALDAIGDAQKGYESSVQRVNINTACGKENIQVGKPAVDIPDMQCQDFMSPKECLLLFNVCDPVVCPSSRCDLGGNYPVADVVRSGIVGSLALCLPNIKEDIYVPICLSGVKAGMDSLISVQKNYKDCLQENLDTGATIGICDEIHSIYLCDFFWNQVGPLSQIAIPKLFEFMTGQPGSRGGGEYAGVQSAWKNAQDSANYMTQYYGVNSFQAFNVKATEGIGKAVCKNFISGTVPSDVGLSSLIEPRSPPQFSAWFSERTFTTATVPPTAQYKVFYHIYAGENNLENIGAYYSVYLKSPAGTSFYQANPTVTVASGYIAKGDYASETKDFTAPSGYKELCVRVNAQEECGFKQVSTEFGLNYLNDLYMKEQASQTDINSETTCVSGTLSLYSLVNPNLQAGAQEIIDPALYDRGIIRVCSTDNPGKGTDPAAGTKSGRWQEVGTCDDGRGNIKCYIDTKSVKDVIKSIDIEDQTLEEVSNNLEKLREGDFILDFEGELNKIEKLKKEKGSLEVIDYVTKLIEKAIFAQQKAKLLMIRGDVYAEITKIIFDRYISDKEKLRLKELSESVEDMDDAGLVTDRWTLRTALEEVQTREGSYLENKFFIDGIYVDGILSYDDWVKIKGGTLTNWQEDMEFVRILLEKKLIERGKLTFDDDSVLTTERDRWTLRTALEELQTREGKYSGNKIFINNLYIDNVLSEDEWNEINGEGFFNLEENMEFVRVLLEQKLFEGVKDTDDVGLDTGFVEIPNPKNIGRVDNEEISARFKDFGNIIPTIALEYDVPELLIKAIIIQESEAKIDALGDSGSSYGLMQIRQVAVDHVADYYNDIKHTSLKLQFSAGEGSLPSINIKLGTAYYKLLENTYKAQGNSDDALKKISLAAYNWGPGNIENNCTKNGETKWENCRNVPNSVLQYISNVIYYEKNIYLD